AQGGGDGLGDEGRVAQGGQLGQPGAVGEALADAGGQLERQAGLANPAAAGQGEQALGGQEVAQLVQLALAAEEGADRGGQVVARGGRGGGGGGGWGRGGGRPGAVAPRRQPSSPARLCSLRTPPSPSPSGGRR